MSHEPPFPYILTQPMKELIRYCVQGFCAVHSRSPDYAPGMIMAMFLSCYAVMSPVERARTLVLFRQMVPPIGEERFEDGADFLDFLKEVAKDQGLIKEAPDENASNQQ